MLMALFMLNVALELVLGVYFLYKDRNVSVEPVHDSPYLYYEFDDLEDTNADGFKTNYYRQKPKGTYRILLTGGSVARGKKPEESIAQFLQNKLREQLHTDKIEVVNAGVSGYVLEQEFILTQLKLQYYKPDMIIGLDGYNDALTLLQNPDWTTMALKPQQWNDFRVIWENRWQEKWHSRFAYFFKNTDRVKAAMLRKKAHNAVDWATVTQTTAFDTALLEYRHILNDMYAFCSAKGIKYIPFVQPMQIDKAKTRFGEAEGAFMATFMDRVANRDSVVDLSHYFDEHQDLFYDDVHVTTEGNERFADAMLMFVKPQVEAALSLPQQDNEQGQHDQ